MNPNPNALTNPHSSPQYESSALRLNKNLALFASTRTLALSAPTRNRFEVGELLPSFKLEEAEADDGEPNGHIRVSSDAAKYSSRAIASPLFPGLRSSCRCSRILARSCLIFGKRFSFLYRLIDGRLYNLKKDVSVQDSKHRKTLSEVSL
ncbi:hypothetical protein ACSQ67_021118 [Phaseolus vulgaris]